MNIARVRYFFMILPIFVCLVTTKAAFSDESDSMKVDNVAILAKCFGNVRYFYPKPGDYAFEWDKLLYHSIREILTSTSIGEGTYFIRKNLHPIAPSLHIYSLNGNAQQIEMLKRDEQYHLKLLGTAFVQYKGYQPVENPEMKKQVISDMANLKFPMDENSLSHIDEIIGDNGNLGMLLPLRLPLINGSVQDSKTSRYTINQLRGTLARIDFEQTETLDPMILALTDLVKTWNVFRLFHPYRDVSGLDWDELLRNSIVDVMFNGAGAIHYVDCMETFIGKSMDGHAYYMPGNRSVKLAGPPFKVEIRNFQARIIESLHEDFQKGDVVIEIAGMKSEEHISQCLNLIAGSPHWKNEIAAFDRFGFFETESIVSLKVLRNTDTLNLTYKANNGPFWQKSNLNEVLELKDGGYYIDLNKISYSSFSEHLNEFEKASYLLLDLRHYPNFELDSIMAHFSKDTLYSEYFSDLQIYHPDYEYVTYSFNDTDRWVIPPLTPYLNAPKTLIVSSLTQSYAESMAYTFKRGELGQLVGSTTAGCSGDMRKVDLPGGGYFYFTGLRSQNKNFKAFFFDGIRVEEEFNFNHLNEQLFQEYVMKKMKSK